MTITKELHIEKRKGYIWIRLPNEIKRDNFIQIESRIESSLTGNKDNVILDLLNTQTIYSILITLIMHIRKQVMRSRGSLCLVNISKKNQAQIKSMNLDKILTIYENEKEIDQI